MTPIDRKKLKLVQEACVLLDELYVLAGVTGGALVTMGYDDETDTTLLISMRYVPGKVDPSDLGIPDEAATRLTEQPALTLVPKE